LLRMDAQRFDKAERLVLKADSLTLLRLETDPLSVSRWLVNLLRRCRTYLFDENQATSATELATSGIRELSGDFWWIRFNKVSTDTIV